MMKNRWLWLALISMVLAMFVFAGCGSPDTAAPAEEADEVAEPDEEETSEEADEENVFTLDEIAQFDGKDGRPAYIVVDGIVYDVTNVGPWRSGSHYGFEAGADVTDALASAAPHGVSMLNQAEIVGKIAE